MHPEAVALAGLQPRHVAVPHVRVHLGQVEALLHPLVIDEAQLDTLRHFGEQGEVDAAAVVGSAERIGVPWPDLHGPIVVHGNQCLARLP